MGTTDSAILFSSKDSARAELKSLRLNASHLDFVQSLEDSIHQNVIKLVQVLFPEQKQITIASYMSFGTEVSLKSLRIQESSNYQICYPRVTDSGLVFYKAKALSDFEKSSWGVMEPKAACEQVKLSAIDLMLIPGLGFSRWGHRVGYGQGHYDKSIKGYNGPKVGINFKSQIIEQDHFFEPHDVAMDYVVTDEYILQVKKG